jgi:hypothetical protein
MATERQIDRYEVLLPPLGRALRDALTCLRVDQLTRVDFARVIALLREHRNSLAPRLRIADKVNRHARELALEASGRNPSRQLTDEGWVIPTSEPTDRVHVPHIYWIGALVLARDAYDDLPNDPDGASYSASTVTDLLEALKLVHGGFFIDGRMSIAKHVREEEARNRSERAALGAPKPRFSDEALLLFRDQFIARHGKSRGWISAAALEFNVGDSAISKRLGRLHQDTSGDD